MEPYRVGALADLISSASKIKQENGEKKKGKKKKSLDNLFTSRLPPAPEPIKQEVISKVKKEVAESKSPNLSIFYWFECVGTCKEHVHIYIVTVPNSQTI